MGRFQTGKSVLNGVPAGISIWTYFILNIYSSNDLDDDITSKVLKFAHNTKVYRKIKK